MALSLRSHTLFLPRSPSFSPIHSFVPSNFHSSKPFYFLSLKSKANNLLSAAPREISEGSERLEYIQENEQKDQRRTLYAVNLPWDYSEEEVSRLFLGFGTVENVEVIKQNNGKGRGYAFITMASVEGARNAIDKFHLSELQGRIIRVEYAKASERPSTSSTSAPESEMRHKIYVSNLSWKVRSSDLRDFFFPNFTPLSTRVIFEKPSGRAAGYGFVSFATKEETETAISALDGKELMGRPIRLRLNQKNGNSGKE